MVLGRACRDCLVSISGMLSEPLYFLGYNLSGGGLYRASFLTSRAEFTSMSGVPEYIGAKGCPRLGVPSLLSLISR
jgi:hypothetical protein